MREGLCGEGEAEGSHRQGLAPDARPLKGSEGRGRTRRSPARGAGEQCRLPGPPGPAGSGPQTAGPGGSILTSSQGLSQSPPAASKSRAPGVIPGLTFPPGDSKVGLTFPISKGHWGRLHLLQAGWG